MATPIKDAMSTIATAWVATTPPSYTTIAYRENTERDPLEGVDADRTFEFSEEEQGEVIGCRGVDLTQQAWTFEARLCLSAAGRGQDDLTDAIVDEIAALSRSFDLISSWPSGVLIVNRGPAIKLPPEDGSEERFVIFPFEAITEET